MHCKEAISLVMRRSQHIRSAMLGKHQPHHTLGSGCLLIKRGVLLSPRGLLVRLLYGSSNTDEHMQSIETCRSNMTVDPKRRLASRLGMPGATYEMVALECP